jgi:pyrroline-5-carboxylate reductase
VQAGEANGLPSGMAQLLATQSCLGAGMLARDADLPTAALRREVCVPGGSTEKAIACLKEFNFHEAVRRAVERSLQANKAMRFVE